jgi:hypothetical protein
VQPTIQSQLESCADSPSELETPTSNDLSSSTINVALSSETRVISATGDSSVRDCKTGEVVSFEEIDDIEDDTTNDSEHTDDIEDNTTDELEPTCLPSPDLKHIFSHSSNDNQDLDVELGRLLTDDFLNFLENNENNESFPC